jgi:PUA domain protein
MFKKFTKTEDVASSTKMKSSVQRGIRQKLTEQIPLLLSPSAANEGSTILDDIWPKKVDLMLVKWCASLYGPSRHDSVVPAANTCLSSPWTTNRSSSNTLMGPTIPPCASYTNVSHAAFLPNPPDSTQDPTLLPRAQVDTGAIKFVLAGANIMCPGMTSKGGDLPAGLEAERVVAVHAQGKEHACAVGLSKMSTADMKSINKGIGVENVHVRAGYIGWVRLIRRSFWATTCGIWARAGYEAVAWAASQDRIAVLDILAWIWSAFEVRLASGDRTSMTKSSRGGKLSSRRFLATVFACWRARRGM